MKLTSHVKKLALSAAAACTLLGGAQAQANEAFAACASTPRAVFDGNIVEAAIATPELSTLVDAVVAAGLDTTLAQAENITVYAPTNDAFAAIPPMILDGILADTDVLTSVLTYHVSAGRRDPRIHFTSVRRNTLQGQRVYYGFIDGHARVNSAAVNCQGVRTSNGVVWLIDSVLLPQF
jgi:uncharacterized surface protein with fasciclin (FAS1) repeats